MPIRGFHTIWKQRAFTNSVVTDKEVFNNLNHVTNNKSSPYGLSDHCIVFDYGDD